MTHETDEVRRARQWSKLFVLALVSIFIFGMLGFALAVLDADPEATEPPPPSLPAVLDEELAPSPDDEAARSHRTVTNGGVDVTVVMSASRTRP